MQGATLGGPGWWFGLVVLLGTRLDDHLAVRHEVPRWALMAGRRPLSISGCVCLRAAPDF